MQKQVAVAVVVKGKEVLLIRRVSKEPGLDWCFPGGTVEQGESVENAAIREVFEETNCQIKPIKFLGEKVHPLYPHINLVYWHCAYVSGEACVIEPTKHQEVVWKSTTEAANLIERDFEFAEQLFKEIA